MNREEEKKLYPIIQACVEGKEIHVKVMESQTTIMEMNFRIRIICLRTARRSGLKKKIITNNH